MSGTLDQSDASSRLREWPRPREWQWLALFVFVAAIYCSRLTTLPVRGEESRWANGAADMIRLGDWIVPRQQEQVFIDRPPMSSWSMAIVGWVRGQVDLIAIRLPSVLAIVLTSLLIYGYSRTFLSPTGALSAGLAFATAGQVLQIGRLGENESLYTLLLAGALLSWHYFYSIKSMPATAWIIGYALAALATLQKGIQAPAYFTAGIGTYLIVRRDWRALVSWSHLCGIASFLFVVGGWWLLFFLATDWDTAIAVWSKTVTERFGSSGLIVHLVAFPVETWVCLLPWSVLLLGLFWPGVRRALGRMPEPILFCVSALPLPYLSLLMAAFARGRYFMPLYPLVAVAIGWIIECCVASEPGSIARRGWGRFLAGMAVTCVGISVVFLVAALMPTGFLKEISQPIWFAATLLLVATGAGKVLLKTRQDRRPMAAQIAVLTIAAFLGLVYDGAMINIARREANDMTEPVAQIRSTIPIPEKLVSLGPIYHRFAWYYGHPIEERRWPVRREELQSDTEYFCFDWCRSDTPTRRTQGRGLIWEHTPGTLPFKWEKIAFIPCDPHQTDNPKNGVIIGRVLRSPTSTARRGSQRK